MKPTPSHFSTAPQAQPCSQAEQVPQCQDTAPQLGQEEPSFVQGALQRSCFSLKLLPSRCPAPGGASWPRCWAARGSPWLRVLPGGAAAAASCLLPRAFNSDGSWPRAGEDAGTTPALQVLPYPATRLWFLHCKLNSPWLMCKLISNKNHGGYQFCRTCYIMLRKPFLPVQFLIKRWGLRVAVPCWDLYLCRACPCRALSPCHCCPRLSCFWYARLLQHPFEARPVGCLTESVFESVALCPMTWHYAKPGGAPRSVSKHESRGRA